MDPVPSTICEKSCVVCSICAAGAPSAPTAAVAAIASRASLVDTARPDLRSRPTSVTTLAGRASCGGMVAVTGCTVRAYPRPPTPMLRQCRSRPRVADADGTTE